MSSPVSWHKESGSCIRLVSSELSGMVDPSAPDKGLFDIVFEGKPQSACRLCSVEHSFSDGPPRLMDQYIRGSDVVSTYAAGRQGDVDQYEPQICWRHLAGAGEVIGFELILSAKTSRLDGRPRVLVKSELCGHQSYRLGGSGLTPLERTATQDTQFWQDTQSDWGAGCYVIRLLDGVDYVELVYPADFDATKIQWRATHELAIERELFDNPLEKGVIRRARIRGYFFAHPVELTEVNRVYQQFIDSELPLTT